MQDDEIEQRVKRLELLHLYGFFAITVFGIGYLIYKSKKR